MLVTWKRRNDSAAARVIVSPVPWMVTSSETMSPDGPAKFPFWGLMGVVRLTVPPRIAGRTR